MHDTSMLTLLFLISLTVVGPMISIQIPILRLPTAVLEIIFGIFIGKSGFQFFLPNNLIHHLSELGLLFLMFLAGTEIQFHSGKTGRKQAGSPIIAGSSFILTFCTSLLCAWWINGSEMGPSVWILGLLFTTTSVGIVIPILRENGLLSSAYGQTLLQSALLADVLTLLLLSIVVTEAAPGSGNSPWIPLLALLGWGILLYSLAKPMTGWIYRTRSEMPTSQIGIRAALSILGATLFVTYQLHLELILGSFVAGILLSILSKGQHEVLHDKLEGIGYGFLFPIFFVSLGMGFDITSLKSTETPLLIPMLLGCAYVVKLFGALPFRLRFTGKQTLQAGVLLSTRFTLVIAVSSVGVKLGLITPTADQALVIVAICTVLLSPLLFNTWQKTVHS